MESVRIEELASKEEEALNLKSEWGGSKLPGLQVSKPKGTAGTHKLKEGTKRGRVQEDTKEEEGMDGEVKEGTQPDRKRRKPEEENRKLESGKEKVTPETQKYLPPKPKNFTQLRPNQLLVRRESWSPSTQQGRQGCEVRKEGGSQEAAITRTAKRKLSGSPGDMKEG